MFVSSKINMYTTLTVKKNRSLDDKHHTKKLTTLTIKINFPPSATLGRPII